MLSVQCREKSIMMIHLQLILTHQCREKIFMSHCFCVATRHFVPVRIQTVVGHLHRFSLQHFYLVILLWRLKFKRIVRCCYKISSSYTETVLYINICATWNLYKSCLIIVYYQTDRKFSQLSRDRNEENLYFLRSCASPSFHLLLSL